VRHSENPERDNLIIEERNKGASFRELGKKFNISANRVNQIINTAESKVNLTPFLIRNNKTELYRKQQRDESIAVFGTWAQKVCLLMPHLQAIKAIAEEKNT
jgi:DNA-directed RNA polymerase sigma subunit (sigma70/sigma32)